MPVPWPESRPGIPAERGPAISKVENRAITVQQLRDLHSFIERLCKTRQLKRQNWRLEKNKAGEEIWVRSGRETLSVFEVNMYDITDEVIKPAIEYVERKRHCMDRKRATPDELEPVSNGYSWVEFVSQGVSQEPDIMFSHSWQGRFQDFMTTVNKVVENLKYGGSTKIWICTFAINQFGEDFGDSLKCSPFHKVVSKVCKVVLVADRFASSLRRTWCAFELHVAHAMNKELTIFASMGKVGKEVNNGPLADAIKHWDVTKTDAKEKADRRQILNFLVGADEKDGLKKKEDGRTLDIDPVTKRKVVEDDKEGKIIYNQRFEHQYEVDLFKKYKADFGMLNAVIRATVAGAAVEQDLCCPPPSSPKKADRPLSAHSSSGQRSPSKAGSAAKLPRSSSKGSLARSPMTQEMLQGGTPRSPSKSSGNVKLPPIQKQEGEDPMPRKQEGEPVAGRVAANRKVPMEMRGITLGEVRKAVKPMRDQHWEEYMYEYKHYPGMEITEKEKKAWKEQTVKMVTEPGRGLMYRLARWRNRGFADDVSYAERVYPAEGHVPQYIINDSNDLSFQYTMDALEWMAEALQLTDNAVLFMSSFCVCDWRKEQDEFNDTIESLIRNSYGWIAVLGKTKESILRSNRMEQLQHSFCAARPIYFACDTGILAGMQPFNGHNGARWEFGVFNPRIAWVLLKANWERDAISSDPCSKEACANRIRNQPGGFASFETRLACAAAGPALRDAVAKTDRKSVDKVARICRHRGGLWVDSGLLRGALGETPLHIATAVGNLGMMQVLMDAKASPNAQDNMLETPMHYAAMSGHAAAVGCLLLRGAYVRAWSAYAETPLQVAQQNPAAFLWKCDEKEASSVGDLFSLWETSFLKEMEEKTMELSDTDED